MRQLPGPSCEFAQLLFRFTANDYRDRIDGIDISKIGLHDLRERIVRHQCGF